MDLMFWHSLRVHAMRGAPSPFLLSPHLLPSRGQSGVCAGGPPVLEEVLLCPGVWSGDLRVADQHPTALAAHSCACPSLAGCRARFGRLPPSPGVEGMTEVVSVFWVLSGER